MSEVRNEYAEFLSAVPDCWSKVKMREVGRIVSGGTPSRNAPSLWSGGIPWVTPGELTALLTKEIEKTAETISAAGLAGSGANLLPVNSLLITSRATLGARAVNTVPMATNQGFKSVVPFDRRFTDYLFHLTEKIKPEMVRRASGTTFLEISGSEFSDIVLPLPQADEATKIAEVLDTLDSAIQRTEAVVAKLRAIKQGLLHDLLTRGIDANGDLRPPQPEAPHLYHQTPLGWLPKDWDSCDVFNVSNTVTSGSRDWARYYAESGAVFVRIGNLTREHVNLRLASLSHVRPPRNADGQRTSLEAGDVLISITADLGIVGVIPEDFGEAYINQHIALIRPNANIINARFLGHFLASPASQNYLSKLNDAGAKSGLNLPTIRGLPVMLPERPEQECIAERLDEIDGQISGTLTELAKLKSLKSGLKDDLLTGRVSVSPLL